ncbi:MAG: aspartate aminotransferase family protein [Verrucomicrobia bacterium]|nr:aspartate aminotransferase family protein [Verrucomicrobiota bacterium]
MGPFSRRKVLDLLRQYESRNVTCIADDGSWPIVWERASGVYVWDTEGKKYLDLTGGFGVAAAGHANPRVVQAGRKQMAKLLHAMGDVHPHALKARLARELSRMTFERWGRTGRTVSAAAFRAKTLFCNSGFEAVEAALKTTFLATGRREIIAFQDAYHGLGYGALNATHRGLFREPFRSQLGRFGRFVPFPNNPSDLDSVERSLRKLLRRGNTGAVVVEPIQGRGGINVPPLEFLPLLRRLCERYGALLVLDEIYTGFGRTGRWFACEHSRTVPDIICLGKAMSGGFPLSACVGRADVMDKAWPRSAGEAMHTSTFLGHPVGCAMALAQIKEIASRNLVERSALLGKDLMATLACVKSTPKLELSVRGCGLMVGLEIRLNNGAPATHQTWRMITAMLEKGFILLPEGGDANVISFTPPLTTSAVQLGCAVDTLAEILRRS